MLRAQVLESPLEKKAGVNYGPPGTKTLIYFVDDLNSACRATDQLQTGAAMFCCSCSAAVRRCIPAARLSHSQLLMPHALCSSAR